MIRSFLKKVNPRAFVPLSFRGYSKIKPGVLEYFGKNSLPEHFVKLGAELKYHKKELTFAKGESDYAVVYASFLRLLAKKGYFHPDTRFAVYRKGNGKVAVLGLFPALTPARRHDSWATIEPGSILASLMLKHPGLCFLENGQRREMYDMAFRLDSHSDSIETFFAPENFGVGEKGRGYAIDLGLWVRSSRPSKAILQNVLKSEGYYEKNREKKSGT